MLHDELLCRLQNLTNIKVKKSEIAKILNFGYSAIANREKRNTPYSIEEIEKISQYFNVDILNNKKGNTTGDKMEIPYYSDYRLKTDIKSSAITSIWFDRELVENIWRKDPTNLRIITMLGDKMDSGDYPLKNGDILIIDTSDIDITKVGIYAFTTSNNSYMFVNGVNRRYDGACRFYFTNKAYPEKILTDEDVIKADIRIIGRVIKNLSLCL